MIRIRKFLIMAMLITSIFIFAGCAFADIDLGEGYHVPENFSIVLIASSDGTAIQNAVENIQDGGTIILSGYFNLKRNINIKKNLKIRGVAIKGVGNTVLDHSQAPKKDRVIRCQGNITLEDLTITGGESTNGGGVKIDGGEVNIINCDIHDNKGILGGGGIHSQADKLTLTSCDISNNVSMVAGGGISAIGGTITMIDCNITSNDATYSYGGGVGVSGSTITLSNCTITNNKAGDNGGGIAVINNGKCTSADTTISDNIVKGSENNVYIQ